jgi:16S rRNA (guanine(966)-N(2))-methyltransferase RsmD
MPDRVREAVFAILGARYESLANLPPLHVADVFAGSGSMGLEALSRGAGSCCFFERDPQALEILRQNLANLRVGPEGTVVTRNAWNSAILAPSGRPFDLVLLDPPYADTQDLSEGGFFKRYLRRLAERADNRPLVVLHHRASVSVDVAPGDNWQILDQRAFGTHHVTMLGR